MSGIQDLLRRGVRFVMSLSMMNRWIVLGIDLFLCAVGFFVAVAVRQVMNPVDLIPDIGLWGLVFLLFSSIFFYIFKSYKGLIRHSNLQELWRIMVALTCSSVALYMTLLRYADFEQIFSLMFVVLVTSVTLTIGVRMLIVMLYNYTVSYTGPNSEKTLVYGIGPHSIALAQWINRSSHNRNQVEGFLVRNQKAGKMRINDLPVFDLALDHSDKYFRKYEITTILFSDRRAVRKEKDFISSCMERGLSVMVSPPFNGVDECFQNRIQMKPIQFEDLLGREEIKIDTTRIGSQLNGKVILITGAAGSIGSELVRQLVAFRPELLILFDSAETPMHNLRMEMEQKYVCQKVEVVIGDVRNKQRLDYVFKKYRPQVVYHAAAYKHVPLMEENPCEAVMANVMGTRNLSNFAVQYDAERFVMISTDKAVNPTNVMGATKRIAEIYVQSLAKVCSKSGKQIRFVTTRFGNVLGSNGSVIPHFKSQIERGGPVTVTDERIIRYFMTIPEACRLVLEAASFGKTGEIYVFDMGEPVKIVDLAKRMIEMAGLVPGEDIEIKFTGLRPGEKLYEELLNDKESTVKTQHEKIMGAKVREYDFEAVSNQIKHIIESACEMSVPETIRSMKDLVPEFKSQNSPYEVYDAADLKKIEQPATVG